MLKSMLDKEVFDHYVKPDSGEIIEVRILNCYGYSKAYQGFAKGSVSGYYENYDLFRHDVNLLIAQDEKDQNLQIYNTLQVIDPCLLAYSFNRLTPGAKATSDKDVLYYRWFPIDLDPVRKSGISSSDEELERARIKAMEISEYLSHKGWPAPIRAMSGNGWHLLYPLDDYPAQNSEVQKGIKSSLEKLSAKFSNEHVNLDTTMYNPARLIKLYGTMARKGTHVTSGPYRVGRPHRKSYIDSLGD